MIIRIAAWILLGAAPARAFAQSPAGPPAAAPGERKRAEAARLVGAIHVDGRLDEEAWARAAPITDFVQKEPVEGAPPTDAMDVRILYDADAVYIGARMFARTARDIQAPLGRRDSFGQAEHVVFSFDTFLDRRTAVDFGVTASGVRLDRYHAGDLKDVYDERFDPVWEAQTSRDADGWTAELWIPFAQLRFSRDPEQVWGMNISRFRPTLNEEDYWVLIPRTEQFWSSRFGDLHGISGLRPSRRIELLPYVAGASTVNANRDARNPFDDGKNLAGRTGADLKVGLGPNLTLDATVNPDFGQVEADPAEVNLTAFETRFAEKRPFFLEGSQLFTISHPNFYYSRRIGARPIATATGDFVDYPDASTIVSAAKLTGRLPSKTSVAALSAVTASASARIASAASPIVSAVRVAPTAFWNVARVQQEFGRTGSTAGLLVTSVHRDLASGDPLADLLTKNAMAIAGDTLLRFRRGEYQLQWAGGASFLDGTPKAVERVQRASSHYAQRPDKTYARLDPARTSLAGYSFQSRFERVSGRHWLWYTGLKVDSPFFETNDLANFNNADGIQPTGGITWRETRPGHYVRSYSFGVNQSWEWNFGGDRQTAQIRPSANITWRNYWTTSLSGSRSLHTNDSTLTRGGPLMQKPEAWSETLNIGNRATSQTRWSGAISIGRNEDGGSTNRFAATVAFTPGPRWQLSALPFYDRVTEPQQYVATIPGGGRPEVYDNRYVFAYIHRSTISTEFRMGYTLKPDMNLDVYAEPFAASGRYSDFGELLRPRDRARVTYGATPGTSLVTLADGTRNVSVGDAPFTLAAKDFNTLSFRSNVVLRWNGGRAARSTSCGSRRGPVRKSSATASISATCCDRSARRAATSSP